MTFLASDAIRRSPLEYRAALRGYRGVARACPTVAGVVGRCSVGRAWALYPLRVVVAGPRDIVPPGPRGRKSLLSRSSPTVLGVFYKQLQYAGGWGKDESMILK